MVNDNIMLIPPLKEVVHHDLNQRFETLSIYHFLELTHVVIVALNRPKKRNAMNAKMWREIGQAFDLIGSTGDGCRCVLLIGIGKGFCSGIDISDPSFGLIDMELSDDDDDEGVEVQKMDVARKYLSNRHKILEMQQALTMVEMCSVPVVAAIHGMCIGGAIDLACCADIRVCAPSTRFGIRETRIGLAADVGTLQRLPKIVGHGSRVKELCYTGEDFDAKEAERIGFVSRISESNEKILPIAMQICEKISRNSPVAVCGTKLSLNYSRDHSVRDGLEHIASHNAAALMTEDLPVSIGNISSGDNTAAEYLDLLPHSKL